jgi:hypothetical protein
MSCEFARFTGNSCQNSAEVCAESIVKRLRDKAACSIVPGSTTQTQLADHFLVLLCDAMRLPPYHA